MDSISSISIDDDFSLNLSCLSKRQLQSESFISLANFIQTINIQPEDTKQFLKNISLVRSKYNKNIETSLSIENLIKFHYLSDQKYFYSRNNLNEVLFFRMDSKNEKKPKYLFSKKNIYMFIGLMTIYENRIHKSHFDFVIYFSFFYFS